MASYNYYDNFSGRASTNHGFQTNNLSNRYYQHTGVSGIMNSSNDRRYNHQPSLDQDSSISRKNKKNMRIREERPTSNIAGNVYYPGQDQPLMAMMVVDSSPSSPSSNSQEGGRGYSGIPVLNHHRVSSKKNNITDRNYDTKTNSASGEEKPLSRSSKKRINGITGSVAPALRSANDEEFLTTKKVH